MTIPSKRSGPSSPRPSAKKQKPGSGAPKPGQVLNYSYLWETEYREGRDEGVKDRPVAVVLVTQSVDGLDQVHVVPMTTKPPRRGHPAIEVPKIVREQLGLSAERSWIICDEWNRFAWPGYDIRPSAAASQRSATVSSLPACSARCGTQCLLPLLDGQSIETTSRRNC